MIVIIFIITTGTIIVLESQTTHTNVNWIRHSMSCRVEINNVRTNLLLRQIRGYPLHTINSAVSKRF